MDSNDQVSIPKDRSLWHRFEGSDDYDYETGRFSVSLGKSPALDWCWALFDEIDEIVSFGATSSFRAAISEAELAIHATASAKA